MVSNKQFWVRYIQDVLIPQINMLSDCLENKVLVGFDNICKEAKEIEEKEVALLTTFVRLDSSEADEIYDAAQDKAILHYQAMTEMRQGIINLFVVGSYHMLEQQLSMIYCKESLSKSHGLGMEQIKEKFHEMGINIAAFRSYSKLNELRLLANTIKHGDGSSAHELRELQPDFFLNPNSLFNMRLPHLLLKELQIFQPLSGEDVFVTIEDFKLYTIAIKQFWSEFADAIGSDIN